MTEKTTKMPMRFDAWHTKKGIFIDADQMDRYELSLLPGSGQFIQVTGSEPRWTLLCDWLIPVAHTGVNDINGTEARDNDSVIFEAGVRGGKWQGVVCWYQNGWHIRYMLCHLCGGKCEEKGPSCDPLPLGGSPFWITGNMYVTEFKWNEAETDFKTTDLGEALEDAGRSGELAGS